VARRRLALRRLLWAGWRIGLPLLLALAFAVWVLWPVPPAAMPAWLKPTAASVHFTMTKSRASQPPTPSLPSDKAVHGKEP
jgi:hypothetical protein